MLADLFPLDAHNTAPACYFSIAVHPSSHFSVETPSTTPVSDYSASTFAEPSNPLLAFRPTPSEFMSSPADASRLLQLQTQAAHRPSAEPLQQNRSTSASPSNSSDSSSSSRTGSNASMLSPQVLSCCRCRRESLAGMYQFGVNLYYCSHCARMVGYSAG